MSSNITLSAATRQNLLSLQDTASLLSTTQNRLSTGKKVNSALDNPTNFFTSQSLTARSSDLSALLDGMSNGVQVIQAANQGITSIQKLLETAKSTAQQALADKSGGTTSTISGGHAALAASVTAGITFAAAAGTGDGTQDFSSLAKDGSIDVSLDGGATKTTLRLDSSTLAAATGDLTKVTKDQIITALNSQIAASNLKDKVTATSTPDGRITFATTSTGSDKQIQVSGSANSTLDIGFGKGTGVTAGMLSGKIVGANFDMSATGASIKLSVSDGNKTVDININKDTVIDSVGTKVGAGNAVTQSVIQKAIQKQLDDAGSSLTASFSNNQLTFVTKDVGPDSTVSITGGGGTVDVGFLSAGGVGTATDPVVNTSVGKTEGAAILTTGTTFDLTGDKSIRFTVSDGTKSTDILINKDTTAGGTAVGTSLTLTELTTAINDQLTAAGVNVQSAVTGNKLTLTNQATAGSAKATDKAVVSNNFSTVDVGLGLPSIATGYTRGGGAAATATTAAGSDATDGSSKASVTGGSTINAVTDFSGTKDASFTLKLGNGATKTISLPSATLGSSATTNQASIAKAINDQIALDTGLSGKVQASYVNNKLVIQTTAAGSDQKLTVTAAQNTSGGATAVDIGLGTSAGVLTNSGTDVGGSRGISNVRSALATQFNVILKQITQQAQDSSYNGVNLLYRTSNNANDNTLHISFNEKDGSALDIQGVRFDATGLGLTNVTGDFQSDDDVNAAISQLTTATSQLRTQSSTFGSNLSVVQNRQDFTKQLTTILDTGASNLTSADLNEEAANSQALSTRNSLAISALSLANQAQQGILQLLR